MSLKITNQATDKQKAILRKYEYFGSTGYEIDKLSIAEAAEIIDGLFEEARMHRDDVELDYTDIY